MKKKDTSDINNTTNLKQIVIKAPEGKAIDINYFNESGNVRFVDEKPSTMEFPTKWGVNHLKNGFYIDEDGAVVEIEPLDEDWCDILPSKHLAEQMLIFHQLITMRERYREIEILNDPKLSTSIDWNCDSLKYCLCIISNSIQKLNCNKKRVPFSFQLPQTRDAFMANFGDMILQCKDLLG